MMASKLRRFNPTYEVFTLLLALFSMLGVFLIFILPPESATVEIFRVLDYSVSFFFLFDFLRNLVLAERRLFYLLRWGWLDLLSSIPGAPLFLRLLRFSRIYRGIVRIRSHSRKDLLREFLVQRADTTLLITAITVIVVLTFSSILILDAERAAPNAQISSASDALWWSFVSITTVGYGDLVPVTELGRLIAVLVLTVGVGLFGVLTSYLSSKFLARRGQEQDVSEGQILDELKKLQLRFDQLEARLSKSEKQGGGVESGPADASDS